MFILYQIPCKQWMDAVKLFTRCFTFEPNVKKRSTMRLMIEVLRSRRIVWLLTLWHRIHPGFSGEATNEPRFFSSLYALAPPDPQQFLYNIKSKLYFCLWRQSMYFHVDSATTLYIQAPSRACDKQKCPLNKQKYPTLLMTPRFIQSSATHCAYPWAQKSTKCSMNDCWNAQHCYKAIFRHHPDMRPLCGRRINTM